MAPKRLVMDTEQTSEFQLIMEHIARGDNFLLSGGAGSGKTFSLVQVIIQVICDNPTSRIACMTYTNAAVKEIEERVNHKNLSVSTIHDFLWDNIKHFQKELKLAIIDLANDINVTKIKIGSLENVPVDFFEKDRQEPVKIQYKEYLRLTEGIISHDELIIIADYMFRKYSQLCDIVKDRYKFIFLDEYQDTQKEVVKIFLEYFTQSKKRSIIGFFGDAMQSIYDDGIGNIDIYKGDDEGKVKEVKKTQNRRNPQKIIALANHLRTDGIIQVPSTDIDAPNMLDGQVKEGKIMFLYSPNDDILRVKQFLSEHHGWNFSDSKETKELNLTHNLIAVKAGFQTLMDIYDKDRILDYRNRVKKYMKDNNITIDFSANTFGEVIESLRQLKAGRLSDMEPTRIMSEFIENNPTLYQTAISYNYVEFSKIYVDKDQLVDDKKQDEDDENKTGSKRDNLIKHLYKIQTNIALYTNKQFNYFLRKTDYKQIDNIEAKKVLKQNIESLINVGDKTIEEIINEAHMKGICLIDEKLNKFCQEKRYLYDRVKNVKYCEFQKLYDYLEGKTPFSTQHKTKGTEFNNVLVILDNGKWNNYNFEYLFENRTDKPSVLDRTQKIFYVCCTRAKENLAVFYHNPNVAVINKAKVWFGEENVFEI